MPLMRLVDIIPTNDSAESAQSSEPSLAVDPLDPTKMIAGVFGSSTNPYFKTTDGGATWLDYGTLNHQDKSLEWLQDGSAALTATLLNNVISTYSGTTASSNFGSPINTFNPGHDLDQPWIRTGPSNHVYVGLNDLSNAGGKTASVLVSTNGGSAYNEVTLDRVGSSGLQDAPSIRLAINGSTVYSAFIRWNSLLDSNSDGQRYNSQLVVVRSDNGGADGFTALGTGGNGVQVSTPTDVFSATNNSALTLGQERTGGELAIAVDPNNANHVVIVCGTAPVRGQLELIVSESIDGGSTWSQKYSTASTTRSGEPGLAILTNGGIGLLYDNYNPTTNQLSQHLVTTGDDFASTTDTTLATESNATPTITFDPYVGDFFDLQAIGNTFYGIFSASNADDGTNAQFASNVSFLRKFTGTAGTSSFHLTDNNGGAVASSIDPFFFSYQLGQPAPVVGMVTVTGVGNFNSNGFADFIWTDSSSVMSMWEYNSTSQVVTATDLGATPGWTTLGSAHYSSASTTQMLMDYTPNGTMTLWWVANGALTGINLGQRWSSIGYLATSQFTNNGGLGINDFLVYNGIDTHLYDWWITPQNQLSGIDLTAISGIAWANVGLVTTGQFTANGGSNLLVANNVDHHLYDWWINSNNTLGGIDLGAYWGNVGLVGAGQFTGNGGTNVLVNNTLDHHLYDWWISGSTLQGIDLGAFWVPNVQLVTIGRFDGNTTNTELLVQNTVDHHLYEWWIAGNMLQGIDLGAYWGNVQLIGNSHYNNNSANDELLVHNTTNGDFYEWWITNNQLQGVNLGPSQSLSPSGSSGTAVGVSGIAPSPLAPAAGAPAIDTTPGSTSLMVQAMASFSPGGAVANSSSALLGADPSQQAPLAGPLDHHLAQA